jgi:asparagine synthetase B (glutamine-hydrolysing)
MVRFITRELRKQFEGKYNFQTESDCEVILALYKEKGILLMKWMESSGLLFMMLTKMSIL